MPLSTEHKVEIPQEKVSRLLGRGIACDNAYPAAQTYNYCLSPQCDGKTLHVSGYKINMTSIQFVTADWKKSNFIGWVKILSTRSS